MAELFDSGPHRGIPTPTRHDRDPKGPRRFPGRSVRNPGDRKLPYRSLSGFYFFYFASMGMLLPYLGLYLQSLGFCPRQIGAAMAVLFATKIVAPNILGALTDRYGRRVEMVRTGAILCAIAFSAVWFFPALAFGWFMLVMAVFGFFWSAILSQMEAVTLDHLGENTHRYGRIRLWGSIGFILTVLLLGEWIDGYGVGVLPRGTLALLIGIALSSLWITNPAPVPSSRNPGSLGHILRQPRVLALLAACFLMQVAHGAFYAFYTIYLDEYLYTPSLIGWLWALGVGAEVLFFLIMPGVLKRASLQSLFLSSFAIAVLRWLLVALFPMVLWIQVFAQLLHAATFGVFHAVAILLIHRFFVDNHQGQGQALYNSVGFGAGSTAGALGGGFVWYYLGGQITYLAAAAISLLAFFIVWRWVEEPVPGR